MTYIKIISTVLNSRYDTIQYNTIQYKIATLVNKCLRGLASPYLAELCRSVVHITGRRHLRSAASGKLHVQRTATAIGRTNFAVSGPETWNSLPAELRLSTLSTATFARRLKAHLFVSTEWHVPAARLILLKAARLINIIIIIIIIIMLTCPLQFVQIRCFENWQTHLLLLVGGLA